MSSGRSTAACANQSRSVRHTVMCSSEPAPALDKHLFSMSYSFYDPFLSAAACKTSRGRSSRWRNSFQDFTVRSFKMYCPSQGTAGGRTAAGSGTEQSSPRASGVAALTHLLLWGSGAAEPAPSIPGEKTFPAPSPPPVASHGGRGQSSKNILAFRPG